MNDQLQSVLIQFLTKLVSGTDAAIQYGKEQMPEILQKILIWEFTYSLVVWLLGLVIVASYIWWVSVKFKWWLNNKTKTYTATDNKYELTMFIWTIAAVISLAVLFINIDWLKIWINPNGYLLEYLANLIKR